MFMIKDPITVHDLSSIIIIKKENSVRECL